MISPRILFEGDPAEAYRYVGVAKEFGRSTFAAGILSKVWRLGEDVHIRVMNNIQARVCKVWITAGDSGLWYQFITTGPEITSYSGSLFSVYKGSAVAVKLPKIKTDGSVVWDNVTPIATGSSLEILPDETPISDDTALIQRIKGTVQIQLISQSSYRFHAHIDQPDSYKKYQQLIHSWSSIPGSVYNAGALMPTPYLFVTDKGFDAPPTTINGKRFKLHEPDMDWPHDAAIIRVINEEFGSRNFIVAVDASSRFYCWPYLLDEDVDLGSPYSSQGQKVTVPDERVQSLEAPFPAWVHVPVGDRRDTDWPIDTNSGEPRYVWRFHPQGTKVVGLVLQREPFTGDLWIENVTNDGSGNLTDESYIEEDWEFSSNDIHGVNYTGVPKTDLPGYVEFSIDIEIIGTELTDFTFGLTLLQDQLADAGHYPIAADYLSPVINGWASYGVSGVPGDLVVMELEARRGPMSDLWWVMEGSSERPERYFRQLWAKVIHVESTTVLRKFLILDQPDDYLHSCAYVDAEPQFILSGALAGIDLSKLAFTYQARRQSLFVDAEEYYAASFSGGWFGLRQRWMEEEAGIRIYAFNQVVKEVRGGETFDLWQTLDELTIDSESSVVSPVETGRKSLLPTTGSFSNKNILAYLFKIPYAYQTVEEFLVGLPPTDIGTTVSYELLDPENINDLEYATYNAFYSVLTYSEQHNDPESIKSDVLEILNIISDATVDETFIETWVYPWVKYQLIKVASQINSIGIIEDTENPGRYLPNIVFNSGYGTLFESIGSINYTHFLGSYFLHYRAYQRPAQAASSFTFPAVSGYQTPWLHDYPIGQDAYLHAWWLAIVASTNNKICVSSEGFYAGTHDLFYATQPIPESSIYSVGDPDYTEILNKDRYFFNNAWGRGTDPVSIVKNAKYSIVNKSPSNCLSQLKIDVVGHINEGQTTHEALYETAYAKTLTLPDPGIRVTAITTVGDYYRYEYLYEANFNGNYLPVEPSYPELRVESSRIDHNPILNGSMLFSK